MIDEVLAILKDKLNTYFKLKANVQEDKVAFLDGTKTDPLSFPMNNVVPLLINIEEEKTLRPANRYEGVIVDGIQTKIHPPLNLHLFVLFVSRFSDYQQSLKFLSLIIRFFQRNPVFDQYNTPVLNPEIEKLKLELVTVPISEQNEIWNALRTTYLPSVLYKLSLLVYEDNEAFAPAPETKQIELSLSNAMA